MEIADRGPREDPVPLRERGRAAQGDWCERSSWPVSTFGCGAARVAELEGGGVDVVEEGGAPEGGDERLGPVLGAEDARCLLR